MSIEPQVTSPQPAQPPVTQTQTNSAWSIVSLICGITSYFALPFLGGIIALVTGYVAKDEIKKSNGKLGGDGMDYRRNRSRLD